jgi:hypothetical protein
MRLSGNLQDIKRTRDDANSSIEIQVDQIEYITHKKDGRFFQPFDFLDELDSPIIITGDCLARTDNKHLEEGEHEFQVYDKIEDEYVLNPDKQLFLTTTYDFDADITILTSLDYSVTVSNEEFQQRKRDRANEKKAQKGRKRNKK